MSVHAIGDVQGCYAELRELLREIDFLPGRDEVWLVGDLVNRGPQSLEVLRYVRALGESAKVVLGNHDLHLLAVAYGKGRKPRASDTLEDVLAAPDRDELLDWLRHRPLIHHDARYGTLVHAGLPPQWDLETALACAREVEDALANPESLRELLHGMYGDRPDRWSGELRGMDRLRFTVNCLTRVRVCDAEGRLELGYKGTLEDVPRDYVPWFRAPGRRSRSLRVIFGHWSALDFHDGDGVLAIDTGCVWGRRLCAIRLDEPAALVSVPSQQPLARGD